MRKNSLGRKQHNILNIKDPDPYTSSTVRLSNQKVFLIDHESVVYKKLFEDALKSGSVLTGAESLASVTVKLDSSITADRH